MNENIVQLLLWIHWSECYIKVTEILAKHQTLNRMLEKERIPIIKINRRLQSLQECMIKKKKKSFKKFNMIKLGNFSPL